MGDFEPQEGAGMVVFMLLCTAVIIGFGFVVVTRVIVGAM